MSIRKELRLADSSGFDVYLELISNRLRLSSPKEVPDGIGDLETDSGSASFAVSRDNAFAAFRWLELDEDSALQIESFFVSPASKPARSGVRAKAMRQAPSASFEGFIESWRATACGDALDSSQLPGFTELSVLLASDGQANLTNAEMSSRVGTLESELAYARITLAEQAAELETARENLRHIAVGAKHELDLSELVKQDARHDSSSQPETTGAPALDALPLWAVENAERIVILPRALAGAKKSQYQSPETIMRALELLAGPYRQHRLGEISLAAFNDQMGKEGVQLAGSIGPTLAGEYGSQYYVSWGGRRRFLDMHLAKGGGREPRYCMRIYFFWDATSGRCVVGDCPHHLQNSLS